MKIRLANAGSGTTGVVAVDLPSGLDPDNGTPLGAAPDDAIRATLTVTLALPKAGLLREPARRYRGELVLADIGIPARAYAPLGLEAGGVFREGDLLRMVL